MPNITSKQWFQIVSGSISGLITGAAFMQTLFGQTLTLQIIAGLGLANIMLSSIGATLSGQGNLVRDVAAMPGVTRISVNADATPTLAAAATDSSQPKIGATSPEVRSILLDTAKS
jgi:hypothetical protein